MKKQILYAVVGNDMDWVPKKLYLDMFSANIALHEQYNDYWIESRQAQIIEIVAVSYKEDSDIENDRDNNKENLINNLLMKGR